MKFENKYTKIYCPLCDREIPLDVPKSLHHLIPKSKGGKGGPTVLLHHICHKQIHLLFKENELAKNLNEKRSDSCFTIQGDLNNGLIEEGSL